MNSKEKRIAYFDLKDGQHFEADLALLREKDPDNEWSKKKIFNPEKAAPEILFALLDHASKEEVVANRRKFSKDSTVDPLAEKSVELEGLIDKLKAAGTSEELHSIMQSISEVISSFIELDEKFGPLVASAFNESVIRIDKAKVEAKEAAEKELLNVDLSTLDMEVMLSLLTRLGISVTGQDPDVLRSALEDAKLNLEKTAEGSGEEMTEVPAELGKVNELKAENDELKDQLEQKNEELSDMELEKEDLQDENEQLQEALEEEKKNLPQQSDPQQELKSKKNKSSQKSTGQNSKKSKSSKRR